MAKLLKVKYAYDDKYEHIVLEAKETEKLYRVMTARGTLDFQIRKSETGLNNLSNGRELYIVLADDDNVEDVLKTAVEMINKVLMKKAEIARSRAEKNLLDISNAYDRFMGGERNDQATHWKYVTMEAGGGQTAYGTLKEGDNNDGNAE